MKISKHFEKELSYINNETIKNIVIDTLNKSPECIVHIPASASGKYHPAYSLGEGGLLRHIKAAVGIAHSLIETDIFKNMAFNVETDDSNIINIYKDAAYAALILHDCKKPDDTENHKTRFDHPLLAANLFEENAKKYINDNNASCMRLAIPLIYNCIASHMGQFNTSLNSDIVLPKPNANIEHFVHLCDYLASRKFLIFDFDVYDKVKRQ